MEKRFKRKMNRFIKIYNRLACLQTITNFLVEKDIYNDFI